MPSVLPARCGFCRYWSTMAEAVRISFSHFDVRLQRPNNSSKQEQQVAAAASAITRAAKHGRNNAKKVQKVAAIMTANS